MCAAAVGAFKGGSPEELEAKLTSVDKEEELADMHRAFIDCDFKIPADPDLQWIYIYVTDQRLTSMQWKKLRILWAARHPLALRTIVFPTQHHDIFHSRVGHLQRRYATLQAFSKEYGRA